MNNSDLYTQQNTKKLYPKKIVKIPIDKIVNLIKDRQLLNENYPEDNTNIIELASSIKKDGLIHPIVVRKLDQNTYEKITGGRRILAHKLLGLTEIEAYILPQKTTNFQAYSISLMENVARENLDVISLTELYLKLLAIFIEESINNNMTINSYQNLAEKGREFFYKAKYVKELMDSNSDRISNLGEYQTRIYYACLEFLEKTNISFNFLKRKAALISLDEFIKDLIKQKLLTVLNAKYLSSLKKKSTEEYNYIIISIEKVYKEVENGEIDPDEGKQEIANIIDKQQKIKKFGSIEKSVYIQKLKKRIESILTLVETENIDSAKRQTINTHLQNIEQLLKNEKVVK